MDKKQALTRIRKLIKDGLSYQQIADRMNADNIPTLSGRGKWQKGTIGNLMKQAEGKGDGAKVRSRPVQKSEPKQKGRDRVKTLQAAHAGALKEVDRLNAELSSALKAGAAAENELVGTRRELKDLREVHLSKCRTYAAENDKLREQADSLKAELSKVKQKSTQKETSPDQGQIQQAIESAVLPLVAKIERIESLLADTRLTGKPGRKRGLSLMGWNIVESGGYYRAFKTLNGKKHGVYIGKYYDAETARNKIKAKESKILGQSKQSDQPPEPSPAGGDQADQLTKQEIIKSLIAKHGGQSGTAPIYRVRRDYEAEGHKDFDATLTQLAGEYKLEPLNGDPGETPDAELKRNPESEIGLPYINLQWTGGE